MAGKYVGRVMEEVEINEQYEKWRKPAIGFLVFLVVLTLYFFAYPVLLVRTIESSYLHNIPDSEWLEAAVDWSIIPIDWVYENVDWYENLIDRWAGRK